MSKELARGWDAVETCTLQAISSLIDPIVGVHLDSYFWLLVRHEADLSEHSLALSPLGCGL